MNEIYAEMLAEIGIGDHRPKEVQQEREIRKCCGPLEINHREGYEYCWTCGKIVCPYIYVQEEERFRTKYNEPFGAKSRYSYTKYRPYKSLTHFREHLRRYCGQKFVKMPEALVELLRPEIDVARRDAYQQVARALKKYRNRAFEIQVYDAEMRRHYARTVYGRDYYKHIFSIIYDLGGEQPRVSNIYAMIQTYKNFAYRFSQRTAFLERRSMPSHLMVLDLILRRHGHEPYYELPQLKDVRSRHVVRKILDLLEHADTAEF